MITTATNHGVHINDFLVMSVTETRWYVRLWYFLTLRKTPMRKKYFKVVNISNDTMEIK